MCHSTVDWAAAAEKAEKEPPAAQAATLQRYLACRLAAASRSLSSMIKIIIYVNIAFFYRKVNILHRWSRAEVRRSFITTTVRDESQVTPQGRHR